MASPAREARLRILETRPNAQVVERGRGHLVMYDPDSDPINPTFIFESQVGNIGWHYGENFDIEVDTDWVDTGVRWEMLKAEYHAELQGNSYTYKDPISSEQVSITISDVPQWVNDSNQKQTAAGLNVVSPTASGDVITYPDLLGAGCDLTIEAQTARLKKLLKIPSLAIFNEPTLGGVVYLSLNFRFSKSAGADLFVDGVLWDENTETGGELVEFRDGSNNTLFSFPRPYALDSDSNRIDGTMNLRKTGAQLFVEVRIPYSWMVTAVYPIEIDPTVESLPLASADDGFSATSGSATSLTVTEHYWGVELLTASPQRAVGTRFVMNVPQGDTIDTAYLLVARVSGGETVVAPIRLQADDVDDGGVFTVSLHIMNQITPTTAKVPVKYTKTFNLNVHTRFADDGTDEIKTVVQEIVDRVNWVSGNHIRIVGEGFNGDGDYNSMAAHSYDSSSSLCPILHVEYTSASTITQEGFRFRNDNGSETTATWVTTQDTNTSVQRETNIRLRMLIDNAGASGSTDYSLEYSRRTGTAPDTWDDWKTIT